MIYLDVTGGCVLPLQSGIPRTTRELHRLVTNRRADTLAIRWQPFRHAYTRLSARAQAMLENPVTPARPPRDTTWPLMFAAARDLALPWPAVVPLSRGLCADDALLLTSLFPDNRLAYLEGITRGPGRTVAIFHDAIPLRDRNVPAWERAHHLRALRLLSQMSHVIAVSDAARDDLLALAAENNLPAPRATVIRWPVPFSATRPDFTPPPERTTLLYVSRLKEVKNHAALLAACAQLWHEGRDFALELIGCEDEPVESAAILHEIRRLAAGGRPIRWRAQVSEDDLHAAYRAASFTVFPSRREGFGLPILESFWHGRGVVSSGAEAMGEVSRGPGAIHVDVTRPEEIAAALRALLDDPAACASLAREAHARPLRGWDDYWRELGPILAA